jgi:bifunctional non-homologous end joining protein LigD
MTIYEPMRAQDLATLIRWGEPDPFAGITSRLDPQACAAEVKYDGVRVLAKLLPGRTRVSTGAGAVTAATDLAAVAIPALAGTVLDGEMIAPARPGEVRAPSARAAGWLSCNPAEARMRRAFYKAPLTYRVFDVLNVAGTDWTRRSYRDRRAELERIVRQIRKAYPGCGIMLAEQVPATAEAIEALLAAGEEGVILKTWVSFYYPGKRSAAWQKIKGQADIDVVLTGNWREGTREGTVGSVEVAVYDDAGTLLPVAHVAVKPEMLRTVTPATIAGLAGAVWIIKANGWTGKALRHPRMDRPRDDKPASLCGTDQLVCLPAA